MNDTQKLILTARVIHEANRVLQAQTGEEVSPPFDEAPHWMVLSIMEGIGHAQQGLTPEQLHEKWCETRIADGWFYGPIKDTATKTHPCLVSYDRLPENQRVKDSMFHAIVQAFEAEGAQSMALDEPVDGPVGEETRRIIAGELADGPIGEVTHVALSE